MTPEVAIATRLIAHAYVGGGACKCGWNTADNIDNADPKLWHEYHYFHQASSVLPHSVFDARTFVYLIDTLSYDARGGSAQPFATLEGAKASRPDIAEWKHEVYDDGSESWTQAGRDSISDVVEIVRVEVGP